MATPSKRQKIQEESTHHALLRLCDPFIRTDGNLICPIIKADTSIRVLFTLQEKTFDNILQSVHQETGIETKQSNLSSSDTDLQGNLFIQCVSPYIIDREKLNYFKERLKFHLSKNTTVQNISVDQVDSTEEIIPQPMILESEFKMHKLEQCYKMLSRGQSDETNALCFIKDSIKNSLDEYKEKYTKIAMLSQNGKGKSFLLNLLFLLTSDNEEEYQNNNRKLKLLKDITGDPTIEELGETINKLPDVVKNFLKKYQNKKEKFKKLMESICVEMKPADTRAIEKSKNMLSNLPNYFKEGGDIDEEPYILPQKDLEHSLESTTKCIIHLRYGTIYQMKVEYFSSEDLKQQLFELVSLSRDNLAKRNNKMESMKDRKYKYLRTRFSILTDSKITDINEKALQKFSSYSDIVLSKEVEKFAGRTELYIGSGRSSTKDRLAVKAILKELISPHTSDSEEGTWKYRVAAVKECVLYLPSKILYGGKEILEMPGTDHSDALALDFIERGLSKVDAVCVMSESSFKIAEKEVKDILNNSRFMQDWKKHPESSSLMLLTYPEKNTYGKFKNGDMTKIEKLKKLEKKKREEDLEDLYKLINMSRTDNMDDAVFTSYILPVLHTSIHAQKGNPIEVIQKHACFLKFTGIQKLITHLDAFISSTSKMSFQQLENRLKNLKKNQKTPSIFLAKHGKQLLKKYENREMKATRETELFRSFEHLLTELRKQLESVYEIKFDKMIEDLLAEIEKESKQNWEINEANITRHNAFNPYYAGNAKSKVKISRIILNNTESLKSKIFEFLNKEIDELLNTFKKKAIDLFAQELNSVLETVEQNIEVDSKDFVELSIQNVLSEAQQWYFGKTQKPINERTVGKCIEKSKADSLKKHILHPAYKESDLSFLKQQAKHNIPKTVMTFKKELKNGLLDVHGIRWNSFCSHLKTKGIPKPWKVLLIKLKQLCNSTSCQPQQPDELSVLLKLITATIPK